MACTRRKPTIKDHSDTLETHKEARAAAPPKPWRNPRVVTSAASAVVLLVDWLLGLAGAPPPAPLAAYLAAIVRQNIVFSIAVKALSFSWVSQG